MLFIDSDHKVTEGEKGENPNSSFKNKRFYEKYEQIRKVKFVIQ